MMCLRQHEVDLRYSGHGSGRQRLLGHGMLRPECTLQQVK